MDSVSVLVHSVRLIGKDQKDDLLKAIRLKVCFSFLGVSTVSRLFFAELLVSYAGVCSGMFAGVHVKCLLVLLDLKKKI
jgi:hypothetical protein